MMLVLFLLSKIALFIFMCYNNMKIKDYINQFSKKDIKDNNNIKIIIKRKMKTIKLKIMALIKIKLLIIRKKMKKTINQRKMEKIQLLK